MPSIAIFLFITLPWLNPFSPGPMSAAVPLLFSWACAAGVLVVYATRAHRWEAQRLTRLAALAWLTAALLSTGLALLQYFGATPMWGGWVNSTALGEAYANLRQRNQFASLTSIGLVALLWWTAQVRPGHTGAHGGAAPASPAFFGGLIARGTLAAALLGVGNAASSSRTGLMQLMLVTVLVFMWGGLRRPALRRVLLVTVLTYVLASIALPLLAGLDPFSSGAWARLRAGDAACASRLTLWGNVLHLIAQKPWAGWGWGELDYAHFITLYPGARFCDILDNAHNLPLHLAVELGLPAALLLCGAALALVWRARPWAETDSTRQLAWGVLSVIVLHSLLEYPLWYGPFQVALGLSVWFLWCTRARRGDPAARPGFEGFWHPALVLIGSIAIIVIATIAYIAWDYHRVSQLYLIPKMRASAYRDNTLEKVRDTQLFQNQVRFAALTTTTLTPDNALTLRGLALDLLHFSPEPRVIEKLIASAQLLEQPEEAEFYRVRYQVAFVQHYARWAMPPAP